MKVKKSGDEEGIASEYLVDVVDLTAEDLNLSDHEVNVLQLTHRVLFDQISFFTTIVIALIGLIGFIFREGRETPWESLLLIAVLFFGAGVVLYWTLAPLVHYYGKYMKHKIFYSKIIIIKSILRGMAILFFFVAAGLGVYVFFQDKTSVNNSVSIKCFLGFESVSKSGKNTSADVDGNPKKFSIRLNQTSNVFIGK